VWKKWISEIKDGERFDHCTQLFIATDSKRVLEAFQQAGLKQSILHNPWLDLTDSEAALHKSDMRGEQIMRTALYDMWTASKCQAFLPWRFSSFSRVITAWRRFERPQQSR
jgi:beta-xylosidase